MSSVFDLYDTIDYPVEINGERTFKSVRDITSNIRLTKDTIDNIVNYDLRVLGDDETPEITSNEVYDSPFDNILVMLANDRFDWRNDTPVSSTVFQKYVYEKYSDPYGIHHYEDIDGNIVDNLFDDGDTQGTFAYPKNVFPITNYEYEQRLNEQKRPIQVIKSQYVNLVNQLIKEKLTDE